MLWRRIFGCLAVILSGLAILMGGTQLSHGDTEAARIAQVVKLYLVDTTGVALDDSFNVAVTLFCDQCPDTTGTTLTAAYGSVNGEWLVRGIQRGRLYVVYADDDSGSYVIEDSFFVDGPELAMGAISWSGAFDTLVVPEWALRDSILASRHFDPDSTYDIALGIGASVPDTAISGSIMRNTDFDDFLEAGGYDAEFDSLYVAEHCSTEVAHAESLYSPNAVFDNVSADSISVDTLIANYALVNGAAPLTALPNLSAGYYWYGNSGGYTTSSDGAGGDVTISASNGKHTIPVDGITLSKLNDGADTPVAGQVLVVASGATAVEYLSPGDIFKARFTLAFDKWSFYQAPDTNIYVAGAEVGDWVMLCETDTVPTMTYVGTDRYYPYGCWVRSADSLHFALDETWWNATNGWPDNIEAWEVRGFVIDAP